MIASSAAVVAGMMSLRLVDQQQARVLAHCRLRGIALLVIIVQRSFVEPPFEANGRGTSARNARQLHVIVDIAHRRGQREGGEQRRLCSRHELFRSLVLIC